MRFIGLTIMSNNVILDFPGKSIEENDTPPWAVDAEKGSTYQNFIYETA